MRNWIGLNGLMKVGSLLCGLVLTGSAQAAFVDYYAPGGATEIARWEFNDGQFTDFPGDTYLLADQVGANSQLRMFDSGPHNTPSGGTLSVTDGKYLSASPNTQGAGDELKTAIAGATSSFSYYMRYKFNAATAPHFALTSKGLDAWMFHEANGGALEFRVNAASNGNLNRVVSDLTAASFSDGFHDILVTYDGTTGTANIYSDGVNRGIIHGDANGFGVTDNTVNFNLFRVQNPDNSTGGQPSAAYGLIVDESRVYDGLVQLVPEPASIGLLAFGGLAMLRRSRRERA